MHNLQDQGQDWSAGLEENQGQQLLTHCKVEGRLDQGLKENQGLQQLTVCRAKGRVDQMA